MATLPGRSPRTDLPVLPESESVLDRLDAAMRGKGCLCLSSRCPIHGEGTGVLAAAYNEIERLRSALKAIATLPWQTEAYRDDDACVQIAADALETSRG